MLKIKQYCQVRDRCHFTSKYRGAAHSIYNLQFVKHKEIPEVFYNGTVLSSLKYDHHFIITELVKAFGEEFSCLGENMEKYITFPVPVGKETKRIGKRVKEIKQKIIFYRLQFLDSVRLMATSLLNLVDNLAEEFININVNTDMK